MALISNGSMVLLKYKLNNVCDADHRPANGAQRTMIILIYNNILRLSIQKFRYIVFYQSLKIANTHYLRIKCVLQAHRENNAYCVRIKGVLFSQNRFTESVQEKRTLGEIMSDGGCPQRCSRRQSYSISCSKSVKRFDAKNS